MHSALDALRLNYAQSVPAAEMARDLRELLYESVMKNIKLTALLLCVGIGISSAVSAKPRRKRPPIRLFDVQTLTLSDMNANSQIIPTSTLNRPFDELSWIFFRDPTRFQTNSTDINALVIGLIAVYAPRIVPVLRWPVILIPVFGDVYGLAIWGRLPFTGAFLPR